MVSMPSHRDRRGRAGEVAVASVARMVGARGSIRFLHGIAEHLLIRLRDAVRRADVRRRKDHLEAWSRRRRSLRRRVQRSAYRRKDVDHADCRGRQRPNRHRRGNPLGRVRRLRQLGEP